MKKISLIPVLLASMISATSCSYSAEKPEIPENHSVSPTEIASEATEAPTEKNTLAPYTHGEDGYFNLIDEGIEFDMETQSGGTCWLYAAAASMESAYSKKYEQPIDIVPLEMLDIIYSDDKTEGFFVKDGIDKLELGGWTWIITETLSNGFNGCYIDEALIAADNTQESIKAHIRSYGAVCVGVPDTMDSKKRTIQNYRTLNHVTDKDEDYDHQVTVIGWDDNFPKEFFNDEASQNGAWIAYNSLLGGTGYYYISYDTTLRDPIVLSVSDKYSDIASYDYGNEGDAAIKTGVETVTANKFSKSGKLAAVGTYSVVENQNITIEIYDSSLNQVLCSQDAVLGSKGYHTVELETPLDVSDFAIAIHYSEAAPVEGETWENDCMTYKMTSESEQSFILIDNKWCDLADNSTISALNLDFTPNNCCIKALYKN